MKRLFLALALVAVVVVSAAGAAVGPSDIDRVIAEIQTQRDVLNAEDDGDVTTALGVVREARTRCQTYFHGILNRTDLTPAATYHIWIVYDKLCGPDEGKTNPATFSYAKRIHMAVQQFGADVIQAVNGLRGNL